MRRLLVLVCWPLTLLLLTSGTAMAQAVLTSGDVSIGVSATGALGAGSLPSTSNVPGQMYGIYYAPTSQDAIAPGCFCEGWGVAINGTNSGWSANANGSSGTIIPVSFASSASTATAVTSLSGTGLQISQSFSPSKAPNNLFVDRVTLTNSSASAMSNVQYARAMDWDIPSTEFNEYVTIGGVGATDLVFSNDNGFCPPNPLGSCYATLGGTTNTNFTKAGPTDQGSYFIFDLGSLAPGASTDFDIFYGAGANEAAALAALGIVGAEVYALGYASNGPFGSANINAPVWEFGFAGVGGTPLAGTTPEPTSLLLLGTGLAGLVARKIRGRKA